MNGQGAFLLRTAIHMRTNIFVISPQGGINMFFADYRARKKAEKRKKEYMARVYPPGYSTEPKRQPNPEYKLQTTKEELIQCLITYDHMEREDAEFQAAHMLDWIPQGLKENLDEAVQRKPLSNILYNNYETLFEALEFTSHDRMKWTLYFAIYYLSAEMAGVLPTPKDWIAEYEQALING